MRKKIEVGDEFEMKYGSRCIVIERKSYKEITVQFLDKYKAKIITTGASIQRGNIRNPYEPRLHGVGYLGQGKYLSQQGRSSRREPSYEVWAGMLTRCYDTRNHIRQPQYADCTIREDWHNYQTFAEWFHKQRRDEGWQIDKDLLILGNREYSEDACSFVPKEVNTMLMDCGSVRGDLPQGVSLSRGKFRARLKVDSKEKWLGYFPTPELAFQAYKTAKEENIKRVANKYRGVLDPRIYRNLMNYEVNIDD